MHFIDYAVLVLITPLTAAVCYLYFLAVIGLTRHKRYPSLTRGYNFLVLIPAHNEETVISDTLKSLLTVRPVGKTTLAVIADNCSDNTARIARVLDVDVLERTDETNRGKGHALHWAISRFNLDSFDGVVVVDADTVVESNMLEAVAQSFETGADAVQLYNVVTVSEDTHLSHLQHMASIAENLFFYKPRGILGLPVLLRGTGMGLTAGLLKKHPWSSFSVTEDVDYAVDVLKEGARIDFNTHSIVRSAAPSSYRQSASQKTRWAGGTVRLIKDKVLRLTFLGLKTGKPSLVELGLSFFLLSRPLLIYFVALAMLISLLPGAALRISFAWWGFTLIALLILYNVLGIIFVRNKLPALKALLFLPVYGIWFFFIQIAAVFRSGRLSWIRTQRDDGR